MFKGRKLPKRLSEQSRWSVEKANNVSVALFNDEDSVEQEVLISGIGCAVVVRGQDLKVWVESESG